MQLNRREAAAHLRRPRADDADVFELLARWARHGVECGVVTDGPRPVLALYRGHRYRAVPPAIEPVNPIGSGDCLLAGLIDARLSSLDPEPALRRAVACAVANALVWDAGAIDPERVGGLEEAVEVECLPR
jgi:fructose-1-phosphate kinase PfkB-like protein